MHNTHRLRIQIQVASNSPNAESKPRDTQRPVPVFGSSNQTAILQLGLCEIVIEVKVNDRDMVVAINPKSLKLLCLILDAIFL